VGETRVISVWKAEIHIRSTIKEEDPVEVVKTTRRNEVHPSPGGRANVQHDEKALHGKKETACSTVSGRRARHFTIGGKVSYEKGGEVIRMGSKHPCNVEKTRVKGGKKKHR